MKTEASCFAGIRNDVVVRSKHVIGIGPPYNIAVRVLLEAVVLDNAVPNRTFVSHGPRKADMPWRGQFHFGENGKIVRQKLASYQVSGGHVECLGCARRGG